ncbi:MAG: FtsX-like permease family protein [Acidimicrobiales bacterium]
MFTLTIRNLVAHRMRLAATAFAVVLGVAFMAGTLVFNDTLTASFHSIAGELNGEADAIVRASQPVDLAFGQTGERVDASLVDTIRTVPGVDQVATRTTGYAQVVGADGELVGDPEQAPTFAMNWVASEALNPYRLVEGAPPGADDQVVIDTETARVAGYGPGDEVTVITPSGPGSFTVSGLADFGSTGEMGGATAVLFSDGAATELLGQPGLVDSIAVTGADGVDQAQLVEAIARAVPGTVEVVSGDQVRADDEAHFDEILGPFKIFLLVFAFIAVFVGAFIINNTFSISVAQRTREMAMLRAIGASRRQVLRAMLTEAVVVGVVASAVGLMVGTLVAFGIRALITAVGLEMPDHALVVSTGAMALAFGVGVVVTVVSAFLPARRAGKVRPIAALRDVAIERVDVRFRRMISGGTTTAAGVAVLLFGLAQKEIALVGLGALILLIGAAVLAPVTARPAAQVIGVGLRFGGLPGELATRNAMRNPKRTARTSSALMIGVALITFITVFAASIRTSFGAALESDFHGTHLIDSGAWDGSGGLSTELAAALRTAPGVELVTANRVTAAVVDGEQTSNLEAFDATLPTMFDLGSIEGDVTALGADGIAVSEDEAADRGWAIGDTVAVLLPTGPVDLTVRAVYEDAKWVGPEFVDTALYDRYLPAQLDYRVYVDGDDQAVRATADRFHVEVLDRQGFADAVSGDIDQMLGLVYGLLALAVIIALFGVANTIALSVHERTRELGLLRAVGMARSQIRRTIRGEAVIVAVYGATTGALVGIFFAWATLRALAEYGFDDFTLPVAKLAVMAVVAGVAGAGAAVFPARRAARLDVLEALAAT